MCNMPEAEPQEPIAVQMLYVVLILLDAFWQTQVAKSLIEPSFALQ